MRPLLALLLAATPALAGPADAPALAPAFITARLTAIGYVTPSRPRPGGGEGISGCTATLISPTHVLTAAHCLVRAERPGDVHITFGWRADGPPLWRGTAVRVDIPAGYGGEPFSLDTASVDVALVTLPRPVPGDLVAPIPLAGPATDAFDRAAFAIWGYPMGRPTELSGHDGCRATPRPFGPLIVTDCTVVQGFSGAPLLADTPGGPRVVAVVVASFPEAAAPVRSLATRPDALGPLP
ncbi:trypsin-like serine protease [Rhodobacterales bacterium HKCCE2091]|nr:trypsin-like serine protease [Rhodobacterales bacterium HKCCE2091]